MLSHILKIFQSEKIDLSEILERDALIIDVRQPGEFIQGHIEESINIPLNELNLQIPELKLLQRPIITCCRSGMRSGTGENILKNAGIEAYNGGGWKQLKEQLVSNT